MYISISVYMLLPIEAFMWDFLMLNKVILCCTNLFDELFFFSQDFLSF